MRAKHLALCMFILAMIAGGAGAQTIPSCPVTRTVIVHATIVVSGTNFNGNCTRYVAGQELGDGSLRYSPLSRQKFSENKVDRW